MVAKEWPEFANLPSPPCNFVEVCFVMIVFMSGKSTESFKNQHTRLHSGGKPEETLVGERFWGRVVVTMIPFGY